METVVLDIDGIVVKARKGTTVLQAALDAGIYIPSLCYHPNLTSLGACRLCLVEIQGMRGLPAACTTLAADKMAVKTGTPQIEQVRRISMEMMLAAHPDDCPVCAQDLDCELHAVAQYLGVTEQRLRRRSKEIPPDNSNPLFVIDLDRCILCGRCVRACYEMRGVGVLSFIKRGKQTYIGTAFGRSLAEAGCSFCGACVEVCPTGALMDKDGLLEAGIAREAALVPCEFKCPAGINIPRYIQLISEKKYSESVAVIREKVPFPWVLGCVCDHPCESVCRRNELNEAVFIRGLKRFAAERDTGLWKKLSQQAPSTGKRVAIVGSGPAGLTAAYYLAKLGHSVTVFESLPTSGGMMRVGIPEYRLPRHVLDSEIEEIIRVGIELRFNTKIESLNDIFEQGYQAIFVAVGAHQGTKMRVEGEDSPGVIEAITLLRDVSLGQEVRLGNKVAVIGGGNVAIDAARTALRLGVPDVTIIYRRTRAEMPAMSEEVEDALQEGVTIAYLTAPAKIWNENGVVKLECIRMELGEPDASGRRRPVPIRGSEFVSDYDSVISAIGQIPEVPSGFQVETGWGNLIQVNDGDKATSLEGVFAGGDAVTGPSSVIEAIAGGRKGAIGIDKYLGGSGIIDEQLAPVEDVDFWLGRDGNGACQARCGMSHVPVDERLGSFREVEHCYDEETAARESLRCLQCDLRLKISPVKFPPRVGSTRDGGT